MSDTKAKPLMWRTFATEFVGKNQYTAAQAFQIKNVYYKNLCAYEITTHWEKEPPPKEILEEVTAKGGNVMGRTIENFIKPAARQEDAGDSSDVSPEQKTPKEEKIEAVEDPGSATGRSTRGLRHQPPQRVLFQPDLTSARQTRGQMQTGTGSPAPGSGVNGNMNAAYLSNGASATLASYEPSQSYPLSLKPVTTPASNPDFYRSERKRKAEANAGPLAKKYRNIMLPGTGFIGPNIYMRAQLALQSGLPDEEQYALHHLVKISHERGDKYRFDQFPGLAESLVKKALQVSSLFYDVEWDVSYEEDAMGADDETINGLSGTSDIIQTLKSRIPLASDDSVHDSHFLSQLNRITEAGLVLRNMCLQTENGQYLARLPFVRDYLAIVLNLPQNDAIAELQHYALDTAEQILVWCDLGPQDALYQSLLAQLNGSDRGCITTSLRTISRIAMHLAPPKRLADVPPEVLRNVQHWLLADDEELRSACLDFLFQYTSFADNVDNLLQTVEAEAMARQLSALLLFGAKEHTRQAPTPRKQEDEENAPPPPVPRLARSVVEKLWKLDEPERSSEWLRMCFLADRTNDMTQISLWQAYQQTFAALPPHLPRQLVAGEFIKNVSTTFPGATAQVAGANKYVIRGIRARKAPIDTGMLDGSRGTEKGKELHMCQWTVIVPVQPHRDPITGVQSGPSTQEKPCTEWFKHGDDMLKHILRDHLPLPVGVPPAVADSDKMDVDSGLSRPASAMSNGLTNGITPHSSGDLFDFTAADKTTHRCRWAGCRRVSPEFSGGKTSRTALLARHIQTHLPDTSSMGSQHNLKPDAAAKVINGEQKYLTTLQDEKEDAAGIPLGAALVLRNIAKFLPKSAPPVAGLDVLTEVVKQKKDDVEAMERLFDDGVRECMFYAFSHNKTIRSYVGSVLRAIQKSSA